MDRILIEGLEVETCIGVYDWERKIKQKLVFDLELFTDINAAAAEDDLSKTLDYKKISDRVADYVATTDYQLIESVANSLCTLLIREFDIPKITLRVSKPSALPEARNTSLIIERSK